MSEDLKALQQQCKKTIEKGSLSFSMASKLFKAEIRTGSHFVYAWCRYCDDQIDLIDLMDLSDEEKQKRQVERLEALIEKTRAAIEGEPQQEQVFQAFQAVVKKYGIPEHYPLELLEGMAMDVRRHRYQSTQDLELYCYRVASVVGLMMVHVMGISSERALKHASDMGMAMQMTNISRDVLEDASMGRVYFPKEWMLDEGVSFKDIADPAHRPAVARLTQRLLKLADSYYRSGEAGLQYLPLRAAFAVAAASAIYSEIGRKVLKRGEQAWDSRTVISKSRKILLLSKAVLRVLLLIPRRIFRPWSSTSIRVIWRYS